LRFLRVWMPTVLALDDTGQIVCAFEELQVMRLRHAASAKTLIV